MIHTQDDNTGETQHMVRSNNDMPIERQGNLHETNNPCQDQFHFLNSLSPPLNTIPIQDRGKQSIKNLKTCTSSYRGVSWYRPAMKWVAQISINGKPNFLGYFDDEKQAALKFDEFAIKYGRKLNFLPYSTKLVTNDNFGQQFNNSQASQESVRTDESYKTISGTSTASAQSVSSNSSTTSTSTSLSLSLSSSSSLFIQSPHLLACNSFERSSSSLSSSSSSPFSTVGDNDIQEQGENLLGENSEGSQRESSSLSCDSLNGRAPFQAVGTCQTSCSDKHTDQRLLPLPLTMPMLTQSPFNLISPIIKNKTPKMFCNSKDEYHSKELTTISEVMEVKKSESQECIPLGKKKGANRRRAEKVFLDKGPSKYVGVRWHRANQKWTSYIRVGGRQMALGAFVEEEDAARKYDQFAARHGRPLNFPVRSDASGPWDTAKAVKNVRTVSKKKKCTASLKGGSTSTTQQQSGSLEGWQVSQVNQSDELKPIAASPCHPPLRDLSLKESDNPTVESDHSLQEKKSAEVYHQGDVVLLLMDNQWLPGVIANSDVYFSELSSKEIPSPVKALQRLWSNPDSSKAIISLQHSKAFVKLFSWISSHPNKQDEEKHQCYEISSFDEVRSMSVTDRAPRGSSSAMKEAFVEARHYLLTRAASASSFAACSPKHTITAASPKRPISSISVSPPPPPPRPPLLPAPPSLASVASMSVLQSSSTGALPPLATYLKSSSSQRPCRSKTRSIALSPLVSASDEGTSALDTLAMLASSSPCFEGTSNTPLSSQGAVNFSSCCSSFAPASSALPTPTSTPTATHAIATPTAAFKSMLTLSDAKTDFAF